DEIRLKGNPNRTAELFERTLKVLETMETEVPDAVPSATTTRAADAPDAVPLPGVRFLPQHEDLRARFRFAEVLGSYSTLNSLLDRYAPAVELTQTMIRTARVSELSDREVTLLEEYREQIELALAHASAHLAQADITEFSSEELRELNDILNEARERFRTLEMILGMRLIEDVENAVDRLREIHEKMATVTRSFTGIFLVDSEIMFVPSGDLVRIVDDIFKAIGNPFVVENIDGTILLAARNLLIQVVSFYAYYGREQIFRLFDTDQGKSGRAKVANYIRSEIKTLFSVCKANNKLVLTRVMDTTEREFEISVEALQFEATRQAIAEVTALVPVTPVIPPPRPRTLLSRLARWLFRQD
ncbi:MAG: hypothetical protein ACU85V_09065, partial [Gammaproteobacteria bacterium]